MCPLINTDAVFDAVIVSVFKQWKGAARPSLLKLFGVSCGGPLELAQLLAECIRPTPDEAAGVFKIVGRYARLDVMKWLVDEFQPIKADAVDAFDNACNGGRLDTARWLAEHFQLTKDDTRDTSLLRVCETGSFQIVRWLVTSFAFERDSAIQAFYHSCELGFLSICKYLVESYKLTADEVRNENRALKLAGTSVVTDWLADSYYTRTLPN